MIDEAITSLAADWRHRYLAADWRRRYEASQQALAMALRENRVRDECLEIAIEALNWYGHNCPVLLCPKAGEALDKIEHHLAELEANDAEDRKGS